MFVKSVEKVLTVVQITNYTSWGTEVKVFPMIFVVGY